MQTKEIMAFKRTNSAQVVVAFQRSNQDCDKIKNSHDVSSSRFHYTTTPTPTPTTTIDRATIKKHPSQQQQTNKQQYQRQKTIRLNWLGTITFLLLAMPIMNIFSELKARVKAAPTNPLPAPSAATARGSLLIPSQVSVESLVQRDSASGHKHIGHLFGGFVRPSTGVDTGKEATPVDNNSHVKNIVRSKRELPAPQSHEHDELLTKQFLLQYPHYCWFDGLENRILVEYPQFRTLVEEHDRVRASKNATKAIELHRQLYKQIYLFELEKFSSGSSANDWNNKQQPTKELHTHNDNNSNSNNSNNNNNKVLEAPSQDRAAYAVFNLWANTPGDFSAKQTEFGNYLEPYFVHSHIEFWSYYYSEDHNKAARDILEQITILAKAGELGPLELLQVSMNIIMLINSYKADLALDKLVNKGLIDENLYDSYFTKMVQLIERDEDFHDATFDYVFTADNNSLVHQMIDPQIERYIVRNLTKELTTA